MDREWKEWGELWQQQKSPDLSAEDVSHALQSMYEKGRRQRRLMIGCFSLTTIVLIGLASVFGGVCTSAGVSLMLLAMAMIMYQMYRQPLQAVKDLDQFNQQGFLQAQEAALRQALLLTSRYMWIYALLLILGINLTYLDALASLSGALRIGIAAGVSLLIGFGFAYSIPRYLGRLKATIDPIMAQLKAWQSD